MLNRMMNETLTHNYSLTATNVLQYYENTNKNKGYTNFRNATSNLAKNEILQC